MRIEREELNGVLYGTELLLIQFLLGLCTYLLQSYDLLEYSTII